MNIFLSSFSGVSVKNLQAAKEFYVELLGLEIKDESMGLEVALPGGGSLFMYEKADHSPATFTILNLVVENIEATVDDLVAKGVTFERYDNMPAKQDERGILRGKAAGQGPDIAWFKDPSDNILSVIEA